jgi:hypothetical protein
MHLENLSFRHRKNYRFQRRRGLSMNLVDISSFYLTVTRYLIETKRYKWDQNNHLVYILNGRPNYQNISAYFVHNCDYSLL